jgi:hypothetical protein
MLGRLVNQQIHETVIDHAMTDMNDLAWSEDKVRVLTD